MLAMDPRGSGKADAPQRINSTQTSRASDQHPHSLGWLKRGLG
ncbi:hypothetical protein EV13_1361 [Prochlorococcus sp. MIT 0702]|nr:hypothetical protein EV12_0785 [Prochlorococcus sp. MIT 0701]KGG28982.1 hypothetical protein EV13_1361 [Prochlorococcus sp. MIT 0702]KGG35531.1 hypothetical protein EV14_0824 [Prochlorococcus sp. MIT 0703]